MTSCSHHGDHGCVPQARERDAQRVGVVEQRAAVLDAACARPRGTSRSGPVLTSISDEISSPAVCSPSGVASVRALSSAKRLTRACVSGSTIWNSSSMARVRSCERSKCARASSSAAYGSGMLRPIAASVPAVSVYRRGARSADTARVERSRRSYFLLLALAAVGRLVHWAVGRAAHRVRRPRGLWTLAAWARERGASARTTREPRLREVEVERVQ